MDMKTILFALLLAFAPVHAGGLQGSKLQPSGGLNSSGKASTTTVAAPAYARIKGGFYVNADGSLGARVVPAKK